MARQLSLSELTFRLKFVYKNVLTDSEEVKHESDYTFAGPLKTGTETNQADRLYVSKSRTLADTAFEHFDLYDLGSYDIGAGAGKDQLGQDWSSAEIVTLAVFSASTSTGDVLVGGIGSANAWNSGFNGSDSSEVVVKPGGFIAMHAPSDPAYACANLSNHALKILASGGDVTYDVVVVARSA